MLAFLPAAPVALTQLNVPFPGGSVVTVRASPNTDIYAWEHKQTLYAPGRRAAAVLFCWESLRFTGCEVMLARPGQPTRALPDSNVRTLLWTPDGRFLLGGGFNTLRLWNPLGGMRSVTVIPGSRSNDPPLALALKGGVLCVRSARSAARYTLPALQRLPGSCP
ncbi:hypothetical protein [Deinococcus aquaedulcis]|uniref:hypothetical protein n=1 Tax=Deinococcus aquaedulcis TaxID=2840455 RepID=UPI001C82EEB8|nr:hypothetical protein [Deinococcus aquaedulcis]